MKTVVGITGGIACGKSYISSIIKEEGYQVISADEIAYDLMLPNQIGLIKTINAFGDSILNSDKSLNRKYLSDIIFNNNEKRELLNSIIHPLVKNEVIRRIITSSYKFIFVEVPLLFESKFEDIFDYIVCVYLPFDEQLKRVMLRDNINEVKATQIINSQMNIEEKKEKSDFIISNLGTMEQTKELVLSLIEKVKEEVFVATTFETVEKSADPLLTTHYYKTDYNGVKNAFLVVLKDLNYTLKFCNDEYCQIRAEGPKINILAKINCLSPRETALNLVVDVFAVFGGAKIGSQVLNDIYVLMASKIEFKGLALHK